MKNERHRRCEKRSRPRYSSSSRIWSARPLARARPSAPSFTPALTTNENFPPAQPRPRPPPSSIRRLSARRGGASSPPQRKTPLPSFLWLRRSRVKRIAFCRESCFMSAATSSRSSHGRDGGSFQRKYVHCSLINTHSVIKAPF